MVADLHIGTYRHAYALAELLPEATIQHGRLLEREGAARPRRPSGRPRPGAAADAPHRDQAPAGRRVHLPLLDASCDVVVFGFGTHENPRDGPRQKVFQEARRILKPGGKVLMFEHGYDFHKLPNLPVRSSTT